MRKVTSERVRASVGSLLALDVLPQTKEACTSIAGRMCVERVEEWISSHVVVGKWFLVS